MKTTMRQLHFIILFFFSMAIHAQEWEDIWHPIYDLDGSIINNVKDSLGVPTHECAYFANQTLRKFRDTKGRQIYTYEQISGNAWDRLLRCEMILSGYESEEYDRDDFSVEKSDERNHAAADSVAARFTCELLEKSEIYAVNMYYNPSPNKGWAWREGKCGCTGTHTGNIYYNPVLHAWRISHCIHGHVYDEELDKVLGGDKKYGITAIGKIHKVQFE